MGSRYFFTAAMYIPAEKEDLFDDVGLRHPSIPPSAVEVCDARSSPPKR